jgi:hypothetical protein
MLWIDYQMEYTEIAESLEQDIMEDEEEQIYWRKRPSIGYILRTPGKKLKTKLGKKLE